VVRVVVVRRRADVKDVVRVRRGAVLPAVVRALRAALVAVAAPNQTRELVVEIARMEAAAAAVPARAKEIVLLVRGRGVGGRGRGRQVEALLADVGLVGCCKGHLCEISAEGEMEMAINFTSIHPKPSI
jgi:hypothetical protein